ncbi:hypothetical protein ACF06P_35785 [Streptomyces sp. NPDC015684]|uniref:hypothetical protein n=1 Tax=Streptomyces sp. NPDC015684 TaxID=3364963 RepID=UPI0036FD60B7
MTDIGRDALVRKLTAEGTRVFTTETYTRQGILDAVRENLRRHAQDPHMQFVAAAGRHLAQEILTVVDLPPADIATVLLAVGGAGGLLADEHDLSGGSLAGALQAAAAELDQRANGGEQP